MKNLFLIASVILGLGFTACNNEDLSSKGQEGNTHVSVTLSMSLGSRAVYPNQNFIGEWLGQDKISTVTIYLMDGTTINQKLITVGAGPTDGYTVSSSGTTITLNPNDNAAIRTTSGPKKVFVVINQTLDLKNWLEAQISNPSGFEAAFYNLPLPLSNVEDTSSPVTSASKLATVSADLTGYDNIVMTNTAEVTINVEPNIDVNETIAVTPKNRAHVSVQRAVARVLITTQSDNYTIGTLGAISDIKWVLAQGENSLYVQQKPSPFTTPNFSWVPDETVPANSFIDHAAGKYDYSGLFEGHSSDPAVMSGTPVLPLAVYDPTDVSTLNIFGDMAKGKFLLPNTHAQGDKTTSGYKKGNTAYVLVRAKFAPATITDGGALAADGTFYLGGQDGKFYSTAQAAYDAGNTQSIAEYTGGKVLYYAWVNPDVIPEWYNSPVLRNNIYHIHITGFKNLGANWNPLYPEDPDDPTPVNPDPKPVVTVDDGTDPNHPVDPPTNPTDPTDPLTTPETYMSVDVTVIPWQVNTYSIILEM